MNIERHTINISVVSAGNVHTASFDGTKASFSADSEERAIGLLLEWLAEQFHKRADGLRGSAQAPPRERVVEFERRETEVRYLNPPNRRRGD